VPNGGASSGSALALAEFYEAGDARFLEEVLAARQDGALGALAERWFRDERPFAREALVAYVLDGCDRPRHRVLVKRLFKLAEKAGDDELMGCFLVAFDGLEKRHLRERRQYDWQSRTWWSEWVLENDARIPARDRFRAKEGEKPARSPYGLERFSHRTRRYAQRRAFRYFRRLGRDDVQRFGRAIRAALVRYEDANLAKPERILDAWGLAHALWWGSPALERRPNGIVLAAGKTLAELVPAPVHPEAWKAPVEELLAFAARARSRTVRAFTVAILERDRSEDLRALPLARLRPLLASPHEELQTFGAKLLEGASGLDALPLPEWLSLLEIENPAALPLLCKLVERHVAPSRLQVPQLVALACARPAPVAELGLRWLRERPPRSARDLDVLLPLRDAACAPVRAEAAGWLCELLAAAPDASPLQLRELLDARHPEVRARALTLLAGSERFGDALELWAALAESPHDDARAALVRHLRTAEEALPPEGLRHVWATSLLAVHRGGRAKRLAAAQVARRIVARPAEAEPLLPLLRLLLRSVRAPERRTALAEIVRAAALRPSLRAALAAGIPELDLGELA
jgi:hypothetical protein